MKFNDVFCLFISIFEIYSNPPVVICSRFKMQLLRRFQAAKCVCFDISIRFTLLLGFLFNACRKVYIHFVYYFVFLRSEFVVVLLWGSKKFYWTMWEPRNWYPIGITLIKCKILQNNVLRFMLCLLNLKGCFVFFIF